ncbi:hypothetical protein [Streptomyces sp. NP160]|nr:hypothetical protein [Streptomyces sp. NP160]
MGRPVRSGPHLRPRRAGLRLVPEDDAADDRTDDRIHDPAARSTALIRG